jgi:hypothetical protein
MSRKERSGFTLSRLPADLRNALQPLADALSRITGASDLGRMKVLTGTVQADLASTATLTDVINARNADAEALRATRVKLNEVISRLQED